MKTYLECFKEVRQQFIESNPGIVSRIEYEANQHTPNLGISEKSFLMMKLENRLSANSRGTVAIQFSR